MAELVPAKQEKEILFAALTRKGYHVIDFSDNEIAKLHLRHMVGGHAPELKNEHLYRFEFPERPGALLRFLRGMGQNWNISLFHYRNHGAAFGKVLMGVQMAKSERKTFQQCLDALGFSYQEVTGNPAYRLFAGGSEVIE